MLTPATGCTGNVRFCVLCLADVLRIAWQSSSARGVFASMFVVTALPLLAQLLEIRAQRDFVQNTIRILSYRDPDWLSSAVLCRLKQQMMAEQEDEEEKVKWRVDAEVKLAMEEFKAAESERAAGTQGTNCVGFSTAFDTLCIVSVCTVGT